MKKLLILVMSLVIMLMVSAVPMFAAEMPEIMALGVTALVEEMTASGEISPGAMDWKSPAPGVSIVYFNVLDKIYGAGNKGGFMIEAKTSPWPRAQESVRQLIYDEGTFDQVNHDGESAGESIVCNGKHIAIEG